MAGVVAWWLGSGHSGCSDGFCGGFRCQHSYGCRVRKNGHPRHAQVRVLTSIGSWGGGRWRYAGHTDSTKRDFGDLRHYCGRVCWRTAGCRLFAWHRFGFDLHIADYRHGQVQSQPRSTHHWVHLGSADEVAARHIPDVLGGDHYLYSHVRRLGHAD